MENTTRYAVQAVRFNITESMRRHPARWIGKNIDITEGYELEEFATLEEAKAYAEDMIDRLSSYDLKNGSGYKVVTIGTDKWGDDEIDGYIEDYHYFTQLKRVYYFDHYTDEDDWFDMYNVTESEQEDYARYGFSEDDLKKIADRNDTTVEDLMNCFDVDYE